MIDYGRKLTQFQASGQSEAIKDHRSMTDPPLQTPLCAHCAHRLSSFKKYFWSSYNKAGVTLRIRQRSVFSTSANCSRRLKKTVARDWSEANNGQQSKCLLAWRSKSKKILNG